MGPGQVREQPEASCAEGNPAGLSSCSGGLRPLDELCVWNPRVFADDARAPRSQASSRGEAKDSALLSSRDAGLLEPPERPQGQASSGVWREDSGLHSRTCRKRRPSSHDDGGGVSVVLPSCSACVGFSGGTTGSSGSL